MTRPQWKRTSMQEGLNGSQPHWKKTSIEATSMEATLNGRQSQ